MPLLINHNSQSLTANTRDGHIKLLAAPVFVLCGRCYWCTIYFNNTKISTNYQSGQKAP